MDTVVGWFNLGLSHSVFDHPQVIYLLLGMSQEEGF